MRAFWDLNHRLSGADEEPDDAWRAAAQRASQQLRACGSGAVPSTTPRPAPALASFGEVAERSLEERKLSALETIAEAARLWIVSMGMPSDAISCTDSLSSSSINRTKMRGMKRMRTRKKGRNLAVRFKIQLPHATAPCFKMPSAGSLRTRG